MTSEEKKDQDRPLMTFALIAYNHERFIREAVEGAFSQTYTPLEIILSDDCSSDRTFKIMKEMDAAYEGPHKIILNCNEINMGLCNHFNLIMEQASGEYIVVAAGDDISLPNRAKASWEILHRNSDATCVSMRSIIVDAEGRPAQTEHLTESKPYLKKYTIKDYLSTPGFHLNGASRTFRKSVFTTFGPLEPTCGTEDSTTFLRCLMMGSAYAYDEAGIYYRVHGNNLSAGGNIHRFNHELIFRQWIKDIQHAYCLGILSNSLTEQLKQQAKKNLVRRHLAAALNQSKFKIGFGLLHIMWSSTFTIKEKGRMVRNTFHKYFSVTMKNK